MLYISCTSNNHEHVSPFVTSVNLMNRFWKRFDYVGIFFTKIDLGTEGSHFDVDN